MGILSRVGFLAGGALLGTAGVKILTGKDAKMVYSHATAAALRAKDDVLTTVDRVRENADDILCDAREINEQRAMEESLAEGK